MVLRPAVLFSKRKSSLYPRREIRIGGITISKGTRIKKGMIIWLDLILNNWKNNLNVETDKDTFVITGIY